MKRNTRQIYTYTKWHELFASPVNPLPESDRVHHLTMMWQALASLTTGAAPTNEDWRMCSDAVNLMETFVLEMKICTDESGLLMDAITALAMAGVRNLEGKPLRLDGPGIYAIRCILEDYAALLEVLPHRTVVQCHRITERRMQAILRGRRQPHDIEVTELIAL